MHRGGRCFVGRVCMYQEDGGLINSIMRWPEHNCNHYEAQGQKCKWKINGTQGETECSICQTNTIPTLIIIYIAAVAATSVVNVSTQINSILVLNGTNFKVWKEAVEIILDYMHLDLALRVEKPIPTLDNLQDVKIEKWERSNRICLMIMKHSIPKAFWGFISESQR
ncbi:hypothetical protein CR513_04824, partial [Mucuna pruriens]